MTEKNLCTVTGNLIVPEECFIDGGAEKMLALLRAKLKEFVPDPTTPKGLEEIRSFAAKFPKSKTAFEKAGKEFKRQYKVKITPIDKERKIFREACDKMRDEARLPLTLHEEEQERIVEVERKRIEQELEDERLKAEQILVDRENEIARKKAEFAKIEADRLKKEQDEEAEIVVKAKAEQDQKDRVANEERIKKEASKKAKKDAQILKDNTGRSRVKMLDAINHPLCFEACRDMSEVSWISYYAERNKTFQDAAKIQWEKEKEEAQRIKDEAAEKKRLGDIETARLKAEQDQKDALDKQRKDQEEKERLKRDRIAEEKRIEDKRLADEKSETDRLARNRNHQKAINRKVVAKLMGIFFSDSDKVHMTEAQAIEIVKELVKDPIPEITINY